MQKITGAASQPAIAERVGIAQSSVNRWKTVIPKSENVIAFAKAYNRPPLEALLAAGLVSEEDIELTQVPRDYAEMTAEELVTEMGRIAAEMRRRIEED
ncbi:helix-turn-helix domain-containing protein [Nonomuraea rubra]|uniref:helix-turn-helix domain-containing protein n=1 Tax=Nonomuraea rubra TaxID=46180 RepID=UPI003617044C